MNAKRKTKKEYCQIVNRWRNSGMSRSSFCRQEKIHPTTFAGWIKKEGGVLSKLQEYRINELNKHGLKTEILKGWKN